ncbi:hypothetical protein L6452_40390 [Arctium lappa]|uniref:Uncharacterized protein n=1 Tax=Arctium lappa TaxID=4217 RepID=A0ACB8XLR4_ARCLA|nr:hypothetical protein L6452_40390 [Arctium lappa]
MLKGSGAVLFKVEGAEVALGASSGDRSSSSAVISSQVPLSAVRSVVSSTDLIVRSSRYYLLLFKFRFSSVVLGSSPCLLLLHLLLKTTCKFFSFPLTSKITESVFLAYRQSHETLVSSEGAASLQSLRSSEVVANGEFNIGLQSLDAYHGLNNVESSDLIHDGISNSPSNPWLSQSQKTSEMASSEALKTTSEL